MMLSVCFTPKPVLYKYSLIVWWQSMVQFVCRINNIAKTTRHILNQIQKKLHLGMISRLIQHLALPRAVLISPCAIIFRVALGQWLK